MQGGWVDPPRPVTRPLPVGAVPGRAPPSPTRRRPSRQPKTVAKILQARNAALKQKAERQQRKTKQDNLPVQDVKKHV